MAVTDMLRGRQVIHTLTNKSGGSVAAGDVVVIGDGTNDNCFTTTTTSSFNARMIGVAADTIANNAAGRVIVEGYAPIVNTNASVARDTFLFTHTVAKEATGSATRAAGAFGQVLETGADPEAILFGMPDATTGSETLAATIGDAKGDIIGFSAADTPVRVAVGANGTALVADSAETAGVKWVGFRGCRVYNSAVQSIANNTNNVVTTYDSEDYDTDGIHSTASNTGRITVPAGMGGKWRLTAFGLWTGNATGIRYGVWYKNGTTEVGFRWRTATLADHGYDPMFQQIAVVLAAADYVEWTVFQNSGAGLNYGDASPYSAWIEAEFLGV